MKISIKDVLKTGFRNVFHNYSFIFLFWGTNFLFASILTLPVFILLKENIAHSFITDQISQGHNFLWFLQFRNFNTFAFKSLELLTLGVSIVYVLIQTFYMGGLVAVFNTPAKNHMVDFFFGGVKFWFRFIKVSSVSILIYIIVFYFYDLSENSRTFLLGKLNLIWFDFIMRAANFTFLIFVIGIVILLSDYTKVSLAIEDKTAIIKEFIRSLKFIRRNFYLVFGTFLAIAVLSAAGAVIYNIIEAFVPRTPFYYLILSFILQQMLVIFRLSIRMFFTATEVFLLKDINAEVIEESDINEIGD